MIAFARTVLIAFALLAAGTAVADELKTFKLKHRLAEEILPLIRPLLDDGVAFTGRGNTLFIRADKATLREAARAIKELDTRAKQLLITVRQGTSSRGEREGFEVAPGRADVYSDRRGRTGSDSQRVRVVEGHWARIQTGEAVPVRSRSTMTHPGGFVSRERTEYRQFNTGFEVPPGRQG